MSNEKFNKILDLANTFKKMSKDEFKKRFKGLGRTLRNNDITDIIKVIRSLESRGILLKGTTRKTTSQEGGFLIFLRPLMSFGLPLMKNVVTALAKSVLIPLGLTTVASAADAVIQK